MNRTVLCAPRNVPRLGRRALLQLLDALVAVDATGRVSLRCSGRYLRSVLLRLGDDPARPLRVRAAASECIGKGRGVHACPDARSWIGLMDALDGDDSSSSSPTILADRFSPALFPFVLYLPGLRSPFNAGNILRTAAAFGISGVVIGLAGPSETHPRFLRAAMGAEIMIPLRRGDLETCRLMLVERGYADGEGREPCVCALESPGQPLGELTAGSGLSLRTIPRIIMLGHEQYGLSAELLERARASGGVWQIPHDGAKSSLNVGVAAGILLHHLINSPD